MIKFLVAVMLLAVIGAPAQNTYRQKLYAYKIQKNNPNIFITDTSRVDRVPTYMVYVELPQADTPIWKTAIIGSDRYDVHADPVGESTVVVGERKKDNVLIKIRPQPDNRLWKLAFDLTSEKTQPDEGAMAGTIALKGAFKNKKVTSTITAMVELVP